MFGVPVHAIQESPGMLASAFNEEEARLFAVALLDFRDKVIASRDEERD